MNKNLKHRLLHQIDILETILCKIRANVDEALIENDRFVELIKKYEIEDNNASQNHEKGC